MLFIVKYSIVISYALSTPVLNSNQPSRDAQLIAAWKFPGNQNIDPSIPFYSESPPVILPVTSTPYIKSTSVYTLFINVTDPNHVAAVLGPGETIDFMVQNVPPKLFSPRLFGRIRVCYVNPFGGVKPDPFQCMKDPTVNLTFTRGSNFFKVRQPDWSRQLANPPPQFPVDIYLGRLYTISDILAFSDEIPQNISFSLGLETDYPGPRVVYMGAYDVFSPQYPLIPPIERFTGGYKMPLSIGVSPEKCLRMSEFVRHGTPMACGQGVAIVGHYDFGDLGIGYWENQLGGGEILFDCGRVPSYEIFKRTAVLNRALQGQLSPHIGKETYLQSSDVDGSSQLNSIIGLTLGVSSLALIVNFIRIFQQESESHDDTEGTPVLARDTDGQLARLLVKAIRLVRRLPRFLPHDRFDDLQEIPLLQYEGSTYGTSTSNTDSQIHDSVLVDVLSERQMQSSVSDHENASP